MITPEPEGNLTPTNRDDDKEGSGPRQKVPQRQLSLTEKFRMAVAAEVSFGTSWQRRFQAVAMFSCSLYFAMPATLFVWASCFSSFARATQGLLYDSDASSLDQRISAGMTLVTVYLGYIALLDRSATTGSRTPFLRKCRAWWNHACDYLPLLLVKTADLPAGEGQRYVLGYHPHGIISVGCFLGFGTDGARVLDLSKDSEPEKTDSGGRGFSHLFPGLDRRVVTLPTNFQTPFLREYLLHLGFLTSDRKTFRNFLVKPNAALIVVVGGAAESMETKEGGIQLVLNKRRGFVREAIVANASLVPIIAYGENDLYHMVEAHDERISSVQSFVKRTFGFAMPLFTGRGVFFTHFGLMPQRRHVVCVVGTPLPPPELTKAHRDFRPEIDRAKDAALNDDGRILIEHHARYVRSLEALNDRFKNAPWNKPGLHRQTTMMIVK